MGEDKLQPCRPPLNKIQPGRPRKVRIRGLEEPLNQYRMRKGGVRMRCSKCRGVGHNSRTCPRNRTKLVNYRGESSSARRHEVKGVLELCHCFFFFLPLICCF
jgi:hypothetical protein